MFLFLFIFNEISLLIQILFYLHSKIQSLSHIISKIFGTNFLSLWVNHPLFNFTEQAKHNSTHESREACHTFRGSYRI